MFGYQQVNVAVQQRDPDSLFNALRGLIAQRKRHPALARGTLRFLETGSEAILAIERALEDETIVAVHNLSPEAQEAALDLPRFAGRRPVDLLGEQPDLPPLDGAAAYRLSLAPYQSVWLRL